MTTTNTKVDTFPSGDDVGAFVVDLGQLWVRAGNAGEDTPKHFSYSFVGNDVSASKQEIVDKDIQMVNGHQQTTSTDLIQNKIKNQKCFPLSFTSLRQNLNVSPCLFQPSKQIINTAFPAWDDLCKDVEPLQLDSTCFETMLNGIFGEKAGLRVDLKGKPILLTEPNQHNRRVREAMTEILFETFGVEAVYTAKRAVLTAFAVGRSGGLVIDIGSQFTSITPVVDGYTLQKHVKEIPIGGELMDYQLTHLLKDMDLLSHIVPLYAVKKQFKIFPNLPPTLETVSTVNLINCSPSFYMYSQRDIIRTMKESIARAADDPLPLSLVNESGRMIHMHSNSAGNNNGPHRYELPDGVSVSCDDFAKKVPECLFNFEWILGRGTPNGPPTELPSSLGGVTSLPQAAAQCVLSCDVDSRRDLLSALILSGGGSMVTGFSDRVTRQFQDVEGLFGNGLKYKVVSPGSTLEKRFLSWIGGSILASLGSFQQMWMSASEYSEHGASLLERRCIQ